jgi:hypothetical protein
LSALTKLKPVNLALICTFLLASCEATPHVDPRVAALQDKLMALESNPELASRGDKIQDTHVSIC